MHPFIDSLLAVAHTQTLEELTHNTMRELDTLSGLDSIFLSRVDEQCDTFEFLHTRNIHPERIRLHEGAVMPWSHTLCRRALAEGVRLTYAADTLWPDIGAVGELRICTYVIEPVHDDQGKLLGTLCGVSNHRRPVSEDARLVMKVVAPLIGHKMQAHRAQERRHWRWLRRS